MQGLVALLEKLSNLILFLALLFTEALEAFLLRPLALRLGVAATIFLGATALIELAGYFRLGLRAPRLGLRTAGGRIIGIAAVLIALLPRRALLRGPLFGRPFLGEYTVLELAGLLVIDIGYQYLVDEVEGALILLVLEVIAGERELVLSEALGLRHPAITRRAQKPECSSGEQQKHYSGRDGYLYSVIHSFPSAIDWYNVLFHDVNVLFEFLNVLGPTRQILSFLAPALERVQHTVEKRFLTLLLFLPAALGLPAGKLFLALTLFRLLGGQAGFLLDLITQESYHPLDLGSVLGLGSEVEENLVVLHRRFELLHFHPQIGTRKVRGRVEAVRRNRLAVAAFGTFVLLYEAQVVSHGEKHAVTLLAGGLHPLAENLHGLVSPTELLIGDTEIHVDRRVLRLGLECLLEQRDRLLRLIAQEQVLTSLEETLRAGESGTDENQHGDQIQGFATHRTPPAAHREV